MLRSVDMRAEFASLFPKFAYAGEREHLKTARVGEYGLIPSIELVQSASLAQGVESRPQIQVVGVAKDYLGLDLVAQLGEVYALDRTARAHGHEDRSLSLPVCSGDESCPCVRRRVGVLKLECQCHLLTVY